MTEAILTTLVDRINSRLYSNFQDGRLRIRFKDNKAYIDRTKVDKYGMDTITFNILQDETFTHVNYYLVGVLGGIDLQTNVY